jgi:group I intron endonuclease
MSVIYKIYCKDENIKDCYIGSTNNLHKRKIRHKSNSNNINSKEYNYKVYKFIRANGGFENFDYIILEQFENIMTKQDLLKIEGQYIKNNNTTLNYIIAGRTVKEYEQDNKKKIDEKNKKYRQDNKEKKKEYNKQYSEDNKEKLKEKVECEFCKSLIRKNHLKRHQQSIKCLKSQTNISYNP